MLRKRLGFKIECGNDASAESIVIAPSFTLGGLQHTGWVAGTVEREGTCIRGVLWTDAGLQRSVAVAMLLQELGEMSDAEWRCFRRLIRDHAGP